MLFNDIVKDLNKVKGFQATNFLHPNWMQKGLLTSREHNPSVMNMPSLKSISASSNLHSQNTRNQGHLLEYPAISTKMEEIKMKNNYAQKETQELDKIFREMKQRKLDYTINLINLASRIRDEGKGIHDEDFKPEYK